MCGLICEGLLLDRLYTRSQCQELERIAIEDFGTPGFELMQRAGRAAFTELLDRWPQARTLSICCGKGNNAGDGYVVAGLAHAVGLHVELLQLGDPAALRGDAALARDWALGEGVQPTVVDTRKARPLIQAVARKTPLRFRTLCRLMNNTVSRAMPATSSQTRVRNMSVLLD